MAWYITDLESEKSAVQRRTQPFYSTRIKNFNNKLNA